MSGMQKEASMSELQFRLLEQGNQVDEDEDVLFMP